ncbi:DMT family transporter [Klebsiella pneumoniae]|nr:DMT family transporter [Klebsiella pneumoniae]EKZ6776657.1 DMT family transporter [Klebsiella pneumoniae]
MDYIFPLLAAILWGANIVITKMATGLISPNEISFLRWFLATIVLTPFVIRPLISHASIVRQNLGKIFILGVLGGVIFQCLAYYAAAYTSAMNMGIIQALMPLMAIILAIMLFRTMPGINTVAGAVISLAGVLIVISGGHISQLISRGLNMGDGMMLLGAFAMAVYNVLLKRWHIEVPLSVSLYLQAVAACIVLLPDYLLSEKHALTMATSGMVLYSAIGASVLAPLTWMAGSRRLGPSRVSLFFNLIPVFTAIMAAVFLSEKFTWSLISGGVLALGGVIYVEITRKFSTANKDQSEVIEDKDNKKAHKFS